MQNSPRNNSTPSVAHAQQGAVRQAVRQAILQTVVQHIEDDLGDRTDACALRSILFSELDVFTRSEIDRALNDASVEGLLVVEGGDTDVLVTLPRGRSAS